MSVSSGWLKAKPDSNSGIFGLALGQTLFKIRCLRAGLGQDLIIILMSLGWPWARPYSKFRRVRAGFGQNPKLHKCHHVQINVKLRCPKMCNCHNFQGWGVQKCVTVIIFSAGASKSVRLAFVQCWGV
jgi:hypothetical protein